MKKTTCEEIKMNQNFRDDSMDKRREFRSESQDTGHISSLSSKQERIARNLEYNLEHNMGSPVEEVMYDPNLSHEIEKFARLNDEKKDLKAQLSTTKIPNERKRIQDRLKEIKHAKNNMLGDKNESKF